MPISPDLTVEKVAISELIPYVKNAKEHPQWQIDQIAASIDQFGMNDPIGVWTNATGQLEIVEGHGRLLACKQLGIEEVPVIRLDHLDDDARRAYVHVHNQLTMNTGFDIDVLNAELTSLPFIDFEDFGFLKIPEFGEELTERSEPENSVNSGKYSTKLKIPQYEPTGKSVSVDDMIDTSKRDELANEIKRSGLKNSEKEFLLEAANRHLVFNYANIAEYYAQNSREFQDLAEKSALVIIDVNDAIAYGYTRFSELMSEFQESED